MKTGAERGGRGRGLAGVGEGGGAVPGGRGDVAAALDALGVGAAVEELAFVLRRAHKAQAFGEVGLGAAIAAHHRVAVICEVVVGSGAAHLATDKPECEQKEPSAKPSGQPRVGLHRHHWASQYLRRQTPPDAQVPVGHC